MAEAALTTVEDWCDKSPTFSFLQLRNRTTIGVKPNLPSSSVYSQSLTFSRYHLVEYGLALTEEPSSEAYTLSAFLEEGQPSEATGEPMTTQQNVANWLNGLITTQFTREEKRHLVVLTENELHLPEPVQPALETSLKKRPDVGVYFRFRNEQIVLLQLEIDSESYKKTCIKLAEGITHQLIWQRNRDDTITSCAGLYVPTFQTGRSFVKLILEWDDLMFVFNVTHTRLSLGELTQSVGDLIRTGLRDVNSVAGRQGTQHSVPMSRQFVTSTFGNEARQVSSGESVVIVNVRQAKVYKRPLIAEYYEKLSKLRYYDLALDHHLTRSLLPITSKVQEYLEFPLLKPPINPEQAKQDLIPFVSSVVFALQELHDFGIAHLDIRLENVCFDSDNRAVLIDLDRSAPVNKKVRSIFGNSVMYPYHSTWVYKQWDYTQLGIMIARILSPGSREEYHTVKPPLPHAFLAKLVNEGEHSKVCFHTNKYFHCLFLTGILDETLFEMWKTAG